MPFPVDPATLGAYVIASSAVVVSPGPDTLLILRHSMASGPRVGLATVAGVQMGIAMHTLLAALGLSVIIASSPTLFTAVSVAGAAYLGYLGLTSFGGALVRIDDSGRTVGAGPWRAAREAVLCNLLNPKVILLFLALMPNFVDPARGAVPVQLAVLGAVLLAINIVWQVPLAFAADMVRRLLGNPTVQRGVSWVTGLILIGFALLIVYEHVL